MAVISQITDGELGSDVRATLNQVVDWVNGNAPIVHAANFTAALSDLEAPLAIGNAAMELPADADVDVPIGSSIDFYASNATPCTFTAGAGATVNAKAAATGLAAQWSAGTAIKTATDTWLVIGDLA